MYILSLEPIPLLSHPLNTTSITRHAHHFQYTIFTNVIMEQRKLNKTRGSWVCYDIESPTSRTI